MLRHFVVTTCDEHVEAVLCPHGRVELYVERWVFCAHAPRLDICMNMCACMCACVRVCIYIYIHKYMYSHIYTFIYTYVWGGYD